MLAYTWAFVAECSYDSAVTTTPRRSVREVGERKIKGANPQVCL
jgi:hypothetical protein